MFLCFNEWYFLSFFILSLKLCSTSCLFLICGKVNWWRCLEEFFWTWIFLGYCIWFSFWKTFLLFWFCKALIINRIIFGFGKLFKLLITSCWKVWITQKFSVVLQPIRKLKQIKSNGTENLSALVCFYICNRLFRSMVLISDQSYSCTLINKDREKRMD